ncbi:MAG: Cd(II)/Pb(II)-responsive transcriptional regulator [Betaproteobacteria bacterium]|nr:Cd(II)/Pb(II)-responsive transcriptional regulator [Betaproteobacteria bacterium]
MKIGELANTAKCTTETIRFYEKAGLLPATGRTAGNYRRYDLTHVERLRFIRNCRALDMTHDEIRALLAMMDAPPEHCGAVNALLDEHIGHVDARIEELLQLKRQLSALQQQCQTKQALDSCGILRGLAAMETEAGRKRHTHLG